MATYTPATSQVNISSAPVTAYMDAVRGIVDTGTKYQDRVAQLGQREQELVWREKERADRLAQQAIDNKRAEAMLAMQQRAEQRDIDKIAKEDATNQAIVDYTNQLGRVKGTYGDNYLSEAQSQKLLEDYNAGKKVQDEYNKIVATNQTLPGRQALLGSIDMPTEVGGVKINARDLITTRNKYTDDLQKQIDDQKKREAEIELTKMNIAANKSIAGINRATQLEVANLADKRLDKQLRQEKELAAYKLQHDPDYINKTIVAANIADSEYNALDTSERNKLIKRFNSLSKETREKNKITSPRDIYLMDNNTRIQNAAREDIMNKTSGDLSTFIDPNTTGNTAKVSEFILKSRKSGFTPTQIQKALMNAPKGAGELEIPWLNKPDIDIEAAQRYLNALRGYYD